MQKQGGRISGLSHCLAVIPPSRYLIKLRKVVYQLRGSMFQHQPFTLWAIMYPRQRMNFIMKQKDTCRMGQGLTQQDLLIIRRQLFVFQNSLKKSKWLPLLVSSAVTESLSPVSPNLPLKWTHPAPLLPRQVCALQTGHLGEAWPRLGS